MTGAYVMAGAVTAKRTVSDGRRGSDGQADCNGYKNGMDFIITLVVVNSHKFFSYTD
jgi:hypothetical protein